MPRYLCLLYYDETKNQPGTPRWEESMPEYGAFGKEAGGAGVMEGGAALQPTTTATSVRVRDGETMTTDGPFAETKEQLGGYYLLQCPNLDEALRWAAKIPAAKDGGVEVRPVMEFD